MKLHFFILSFLCAVLCLGQTLEVRDFITGNPISHVDVLDSKGIWLNATNSSGKILIEASYQNYFILSKDGYQTKKVSFKPVMATKDSIIYLHRAHFILDTLTIEGFKWKSKKINTPSSILTYTKEDIRFSQSPNTADILAQTGEVFVQKSQLGGGSPMMRGFSANRILIVVDGIRMNNAIFRSGNVQNVLGIDPFSIEKAHVILGPGAVLYGSDAMGGVLDFSTQKIINTATNQVHGSFIARHATAAKEKTIHADFSFASPKWTSFTSYTYSSFGHLKMGRHGPDDYLNKHYVIREAGKDKMIENPNPLVQKFSAYNQENFIQKINYKPNAHTKIGYSFSYANTSNIPRYDRLIRYKGDSLRYGEWYYGPQQWIQNALTLELNASKPWADGFTSILAHQYFRESRHSRDFGALVKTNRKEKVNVWSWDNAFYKKLNENNQLFYGLDVQYNHINSSAYKQQRLTHTKTPIASRYPNGSHWSQWGIYAKNIWALNAKTHITSGLRYSYVTSSSTFDKTFYNFPFDNANFSRAALSGSIGSAIQLNKGLNLKLNAATGFRAPNMDDIAKVFDSEPGHVVVPNPHLKPEYLYSLEAGLSKKLGNKALLYINGYYSWLRDALVRRDFSINGQDYIMYDGHLSRVQAIQNASKAQVYGGLISIEYQIKKDLKFLGHLNYTHGEEVLEDGSTAPMRHAAPLFGKAELTYDKPWGKIGVDMLFNGKVGADKLPPNQQSKAYLYALDRNGRPYVPSYYVLNFKSSLNLSAHVILNAGVENITNRRYRPYSSGISAPGRNFVISVQSLF